MVKFQTKPARCMLSVSSAVQFSSQSVQCSVSQLMETRWYDDGVFKHEHNVQGSCLYFHFLSVVFHFILSSFPRSIRHSTLYFFLFFINIFKSIYQT